MTFWFLSRLRRTIFPVTLTIFGGSFPRVVDKEARSLLFKYMGDLYRVATDIFGEPLQSFNGAGSELGGVVFGSVYRALYWCTPSPFRHKPPVGIRYRIFANWLDERLLGCSAVQTALFWFNVPGNLNSSVRSVLPRIPSCFRTPWETPFRWTRALLNFPGSSRGIFPFGRSSSVHHRWLYALRFIPPLSPTFCLEPLNWRFRRRTW